MSASLVNCRHQFSSWVPSKEGPKDAPIVLEIRLKDYCDQHYQEKDEEETSETRNQAKTNSYGRRGIPFMIVGTTGHAKKAENSGLGRIRLHP